jgi:transketolase
MLSPELGTHLPKVRKDCARTLLGLYKKANAGHIGASLSCLEILIDLYFGRAQGDDMVILSKGHAAAGLYTVLAHSGRIPMDRLQTFYQDGTLLAAHPPCGGSIPEIPFGTGSLGHGLSLAAGLAYSQRFTGKNFHVYCIVSDGDCNEGSTWEAAMFAAHHQLSNMTVIVDANGLQGFGKTHEVMDLEPYDKKWEAFGFATAIAPNGNDFGSLDQAFSRLAETAPANRPRCLIARTTKGHGVSYMESRMEWHYLPMNDEQYRLALSELENTHA